MLSRRSFFQSSTLLALAPTVPGFLARTARAAQPRPDGRAVVVVELSGGNDGINTVVPDADEGYARHRQLLRLPPDRLIRINDRVGLHPALRDAGRLLEGGRLAVVQGVSYPNPSRSHFESMAVWQTARPDQRQRGGPGWLGRALGSGRGSADGSPASVYVGVEASPDALRGAPSSSLAHLDDLVVTSDVDPRPAVLPPGPGGDVLAFVRRSMLDAYTASDRLKEFARAEDPGAAYPGTALGHALRLAARLIKGGFGTRVYYTRHTNNGYDTHHAQLTTHAVLLEELAGALRAFLDDLRAARLDDRVAVLVFSEFGRRVQENASHGTDHGTAGPVLVAGGRVWGGLVGTTPSLLDLEDGDLKAGIDFRQVYATVLEDWLGLPAIPALGGRFDKLPLFRT
jgi:uncharacterized protein (DUF1501 family)